MSCGACRKYEAMNNKKTGYCRVTVSRRIVYGKNKECDNFQAKITTGVTR